MVAQTTNLQSKTRIVLSQLICLELVLESAQLVVQRLVLLFQMIHIAIFEAQLAVFILECVYLLLHGGCLSACCCCCTTCLSSLACY
jgi:hypothetical protein